MPIDEVIAILDKNEEVTESYVLIREIKLLLNVNYDHFHPSIKIKIFKSSATKPPYHFEVSHYVKNPTQASAYQTSRAYEDTEELAIKKAISTTTFYIKTAIAEGHEPSEDWLIPNDDF